MTSVFSFGQGVVYQSGYFKENGTYVQGHYKTKANNTNHDNYSTRNNVNPYTGTSGSRAQDYSSQAYNYGAGQNIKTGPRGGQYYNNSAGNKTYIPKRSTPKYPSFYNSTPKRRKQTYRW